MGMNRLSFERKSISEFVMYIDATENGTVRGNQEALDAYIKSVNGVRIGNYQRPRRARSLGDNMGDS